MTTSDSLSKRADELQINAKPWDKLYVCKKSDSTGNQVVTSYDATRRRTQVPDALGNVTRYRYTWDSYLPLYIYDALGRRIGRRSGDGTVHTRYYYDGLNILMTRESSPATGGAWRTRKAYTLKQASIGQIIAEHTATVWASNGTPSIWNHQFYHFDLLGNTTAMTDSNGWVANIIDMEAFGTVLQGGQAGFRLTTKEYDPEAGAYYFNARWYGCEVRLFLQKSPYAPYRENTYVLVQSAPTTHIDPTGRIRICCRGVNIPVVFIIFDHCYLDLGNGERLGSYKRGDYNVPVRNADGDRSGKCGPDFGCAKRGCLIDAARQYGSENHLYDPRSQSCNTFLKIILEQCGVDRGMSPNSSASSMPGS